MFGVMFAERMPDDYRGWAETNHNLYDAVARGMLAHGVMPEPDSREPWFICEAHTPEDVARTCDVFEASLRDALDDRATTLA
jgi:glutamate-1-semialdehyde 2,1-aminomutase